MCGQSDWPNKFGSHASFKLSDWPDQFVDNTSLEWYFWPDKFDGPTYFGIFYFPVRFDCMTLFDKYHWTDKIYSSTFLERVCWIVSLDLFENYWFLINLDWFYFSRWLVNNQITLNWPKRTKLSNSIGWYNASFYWILYRGYLYYNMN